MQTVNFPLKCASPLIIVALLLMSTSFKTDEKEKKARFLTSFPFKLISGTVVFTASVAGKPDSLNFMLDTGCSGISLDSATAAGLKLPLTTSTIKLKSIGDEKQVSFVKNATLAMHGLSINGLNFHINDYSLLSDHFGIHIDGIAGYALLKNFIVKVNYNTRMLELWSPGNLKYPSKGFLMNPSLDKLPVVPTGLRQNRPLNTSFIMDTGADLYLLLSSKFSGDSNIITSNRKIMNIEGTVPGGKSDMQLTIVDEVKFGPYSFKNVPTCIFNDESNVSRYPATAGLLGNALLRRFNMIINYPAKEIHLQPNNFFKEPFTYTYAGFTVVNRNGQAVVEHVAKESPAEKAGLANGDVVYGINNNFSNDIEVYMRMLTHTDDQVKVAVLRDKQVKTVIVTVANLLE